MNKYLACDVLVIGGGPAGSTSAKAIAKTGIKVILIEKRKQIGIPVQCAEYIPSQIIQEIKIPKTVIAQQIDFMQTHIADMEVVKTPNKGFIIHRHLFDQYLVKEATNIGVKLLLNTKATNYEDGIVYAKQNNYELQIEAKIIIGADGPHSIAGKWIGSINTKFIHTAQYQMRLNNELKSTQIYFHRYIPMGYGWVFPKGKIANVGVGVDLAFRQKPKDALHQFIKYLQKKGIIKADVISATSGVIPVGGLVRRLHYKNIILVGDAAGMTHPITGAGISNAVIWGKIAGEITSQSVLANNLDKLSEYEEECRMLLGSPLMRAVQKRITMETAWNNDDDLIKIIQPNWILAKL